MKFKRLVGIDFDNTLVENEYPKIGKLKTRMLEIIGNEQDKYGKENVDFILWTCRRGKELENAIEFIKENKLPIKYFNESHPQALEYFNVVDKIPAKTRKIFTNVLYDDRTRNPIVEDKIIDRLEDILGYVDDDRVHDDIYELVRDIEDGNFLDD